MGRLKWLVAECDLRGLVVDVTLTRGNAGNVGALPGLSAHQRAVDTLVVALKEHRNWYLDLANEHHIGDARHVTADELKTLRERARRLDPQRLITASFGGHDLNEEDLRKSLFTVGLDFVSPHRPRDAESPGQTETRTRACLANMKAMGRSSPVHYQEPFRRGYDRWEPSAADFLADLRGAVAGGAAGWCLHNGSRRGEAGRPWRSFDLHAQRLFDQLDEEERNAVAQAAEQVRRAEPGSTEEGLTISWADNILTVRGRNLPSGVMKVWYLEAFCRPGSTDRDWSQTVIPHGTKLVKAEPDGRRIRLRSTLDDGVIVEHDIRADRDEIDFRLTATNPTDRPSQAHWAQPCVRVDAFTGVKPMPSSEEYLPQCFVFVAGRLTRLPTRPWATKAKYSPGQVWCPAHVDRADVNPRPLSAIVPSSGLIGCFSADGKQVLATAWEPYQELFQGVIACLHSDFRIGGLAAGETKSIRGKLYLTRVPPIFLRKYALSP